MLNAWILGVTVMSGSKWSETEEIMVHFIHQTPALFKKFFLLQVGLGITRQKILPSSSILIQWLYFYSNASHLASHKTWSILPLQSVTEQLFSFITKHCIASCIFLIGWKLLFFFSSNNKNAVTIKYRKVALHNPLCHTSNLQPCQSDTPVFRVWNTRLHYSSFRNGYHESCCDCHVILDSW